MLIAVESIITHNLYTFASRYTLFTQKTCFVLRHLERLEMHKERVSQHFLYVFIFRLLLPQHIQHISLRHWERRLFIHQALECFIAIFKDYFCVAVTVWPVSDKDGDDNYISYLLGGRCSASGTRGQKFYNVHRRNREQPFCICFSRSSWETSIMQKTSDIICRLFWARWVYGRQCVVVFSDVEVYILIVGFPISFPSTNCNLWC